MTSLGLFRNWPLSNRRVSSRKHDYSRISTLVNNPSNVLMHENVHMNAKWVKRCVFHAKVEANTKKIYETAYGCKLCNVHLCKTCHKPFLKGNEFCPVKGVCIIWDIIVEPMTNL